MPDGLDLPRRPFPHLAPEPGGFEAALGRARSRRRRKLAETGAALSLTALLGVGLSMGLTGSQTSGLDEADQSLKIPRPTPTAVTEQSAAPAQSPSPGPAPTGGQTSSPRPAQSPKVKTGTTPGPVVVPPVVRPPREPGETPPVPQPKRDIPDSEPALDQEGSADCVQSKGTIRDGWCLTALAAFQETGSPQWTLSLRVCRILGSGSAELAYDTVQRVDFEVRQGNKLYWKWASGQAFAGQMHDKLFTDGECVTWRVGWEDTDEQGYLLPVGQYSLVAWTTADGMTDVKSTDTFNIAS